MTEMIQKREQVRAQCRVVAHLATAVAGIHREYDTLFAADADLDKLLDIIGERTTSFMNMLGDMLNAMDASTEEDAWTVPVFEEARRLWPAASIEE